LWLSGLIAKSDIRPEVCAGPILRNFKPEIEVSSNRLLLVSEDLDFLFLCASAKKETNSNKVKVKAILFILEIIG
jgi:hypothetical protein